MFSIPVDRHRVGLGQAVAKYKSSSFFFLVVYEPAFSLSELPLAEETTHLPIAFLTLSMDARIRRGDWKMIGSARVAEDLPFPAYKISIGRGDDIMVEDYTGEKSRPAVGAEAELLPFREFCSPVLLEDALKALHGLRPWEEAYEEMRPSRYATTARMFGT
jgi:hypothetical protein